jgi:hypothetical protein
MGRDAGRPWMSRAGGILEQLGARPSRALDVGAGHGHLVHCVRQLGVDGEGLEPSVAGRLAARAIYGIELRKPRTNLGRGYSN